MKAFKLVILLFTAISYAEEIRFCSIGMGRFGTATAKLAVQKGFKMVAAFTRYSKHTKTVGELLGMQDDPSLQFEVSGMNKLEEILDATKPNFCIDATNSTIADIFPHFRRILDKGINILTLSEEAIFPNTRFYWKPRQLFRTLDKVAKENNAVIVGGGYSDSILMPVIPSLTAAMAELNRVRITIFMDTDGGNEKSAGYYAEGMTQKEFDEYAADKLFNMGRWERTVVEAIADGIGYPLLDRNKDKKRETIELYTRKECYKVENENGLQSKLLNKVIPNGHCAGMNITVLGRGRDNMEIIMSVIMAVIPNKNDINDIEIILYGIPETLEFSIKNIDSFTATAASLLHRVPMVLNELQPGFYNVNHLKPNTYWNKVEDWSNTQDVADQNDVELVVDEGTETEQQTDDEKVEDTENKKDL